MCCHESSDSLECRRCCCRRLFAGARLARFTCIDRIAYAARCAIRWKNFHDDMIALAAIDFFWLTDNSKRSLARQPQIDLDPQTADSIFLAAIVLDSAQTVRLVEIYIERIGCRAAPVAACDSRLRIACAVLFLYSTGPTSRYRPCKHGSARKRVVWWRTWGRLSLRVPIIPRGCRSKDLAEDMKKITRRELLRATAVTGSAALVSWFAPQARGTETESPAPLLTDENTFSYLTAAEIVFVEAALGRLIPMDELGPGAKEANVAYFIDQQLAGPFGRAETWYMQGPWQPGTPEQGYQLKLTPAQLYRISINSIDGYCRKRYGGKIFGDLDVIAQDDVLHQLESGELNLTDAPVKEFFGMLWDNAREGYFSDPMYGGNREFAGWKLIGFPGPRYNYTDEIDQYGKPYAQPPVGLLGRQGIKPRKA